MLEEAAAKLEHMHSGSPLLTQGGGAPRSPSWAFSLPFCGVSSKATEEKKKLAEPAPATDTLGPPPVFKPPGNLLGGSRMSRFYNRRTSSRAGSVSTRAGSTICTTASQSGDPSPAGSFLSKRGSQQTAGSRHQSFLWPFGRARGQSRLVGASAVQESCVSEGPTVQDSPALKSSHKLDRAESVSSLLGKTRSIIRGKSFALSRASSATLESTASEATRQPRATTSLPATRAGSTTLEQDACERYPTFISGGGGDEDSALPFVRHLATLTWREHSGGIGGLALTSLWVALRNGVLVRQTGRGGMEATILETHTALQVTIQSTTVNSR